MMPDGRGEALSNNGRTQGESTEDPVQRITPLGPGELWSWNLDTNGFRALISIQGDNSDLSRAPAHRAGSLWFAGARLADFHGLLVRLELETNRFDLWDMDPGPDTGHGTRFLDQAGGAIWVSAFSPLLSRVDPLTRTAVRWNVSTSPAGLAVMQDGTVMMPRSSGTTGIPAVISQLNPLTGELKTWQLPIEEVPFSGVAAPDGTFFFASRRLSRIGRLDPRTGLLTEWSLLPSVINPQVISQDSRGRIWFGDVTAFDRIGRLDPDHNTLAVFQKSGIIVFAARPVDRAHEGKMVAGSDLRFAIDVLKEAPVPETITSITQATLMPVISQAPSEVVDLPFSTVVIEPEALTVFPDDPPDIFRYTVSVVTPIDLTEHRGSIYATAGVFDERVGPSRLYRLVIPEVVADVCRR